MSKKNDKHYHLIGIGGAGVGPLASLLLSKGYKVSGSDVRENPMTLSLKEQGAAVYIGHRPENVDGADVVVYSSAIRPDNPEIQKAKETGIPLVKRAGLLAELMREYQAVTIAGAHGKTTTTSMVSHILSNCGLSPTTALGGIIAGGTYHAPWGKGRHFVAEVDESDGSFLFFHPQISVVTNIDYEHMDFYHDWDNVLKTYAQFLSQTDPDGIIIGCGEDPHLRKILAESGRKYTSYGLSSAYDIYAADIQDTPRENIKQSFTCVYQGRSLGQVFMTIPGRHNTLNVLAAVAVGLYLGLPFEDIQKSLRSYRGVNRRFQLKGNIRSVEIYDDYGHHPTEIASTLASAKLVKTKRLLTVFQPHRYTRTQKLLKGFTRCFCDTDELIVTDIYAASEDPIPGITAEDLTRRIADEIRIPVCYVPRDKLLAHIVSSVREGDLVLTLGAGDITAVSDQLVLELQGRSPQSVGKVLILMGGISSEREISLKSGKGIYEGLLKAGFRAQAVDLRTQNEEEIAAIMDRQKPDLVFLALHGRFGEDGTVQGILERCWIPYTGTNAAASRMAMSKTATQVFLHEHGMPVPRFKALNRADMADTAKAAAGIDFFPVVVKPALEGSSIGITIVRDPKDLPAALNKAFEYGPEVLVEKWIKGKELTAGILDAEALPLIEIRPKESFFDFQAKYKNGTTEYIVPPEIPDWQGEKIQALALKTFGLLGCRDFARIDFILSDEGEAYILEINTIPGFTSTSLLPMAAQVAGLEFPQLVARIVQMAATRQLEKHKKEY